MGIFDRKKKEKGEMSILLKKESIKPAYVNPEAFTEIAEKIIKAYLFAVYSQDTGEIPQIRLEEKFFYRTVSMIERDKAVHRMNCTEVRIDSVEIDSTDIAQQFAIRSVSYDVLFTAVGVCADSDGSPSYPYEDRRLGTFTFLNDQRLGWILSDHIDYGAR